MPARSSRASSGLANAPDQRNRLAGQKGLGVTTAEHAVAVRLVQVGGDLGERLVVAKPDGDRQVFLLLDALRERRQGACRWAAMQRLGSGEIEEGLVDRERLDQRRGLQHELADVPADGAVLAHLRLDHHGVRAELQGLEHRHGRAHAIEARDVAGGRDDAPPAAADDHRLVLQLRPVALLHRGVEGIAVDMSNRERAQFGMAQEAPASALTAARTGSWVQAQAVAAEGRRGQSSGGHSQAAPRTPLASPCLGGSRGVSQRSEKTQSCHRTGTRS